MKRTATSILNGKSIQWVRGNMDSGLWTVIVGGSGTDADAALVCLLRGRLPSLGLTLTPWVVKGGLAFKAAEATVNSISEANVHVIAVVRQVFTRTETT